MSYLGANTSYHPIAGIEDRLRNRIIPDRITIEASKDNEKLTKIILESIKNKNKRSFTVSVDSDVEIDLDPRGLLGYDGYEGFCPDTPVEGLLAVLLAPFMTVGGGILLGTVGGITLAHMSGFSKIGGGLGGALAGVPLGVMLMLAYTGKCISGKK